LRLSLNIKENYNIAQHEASKKFYNKSKRLLYFKTRIFSEDSFTLIWWNY